MSSSNKISNLFDYTKIVSITKEMRLSHFLIPSSLLCGKRV